MKTQKDYEQDIELNHATIKTMLRAFQVIAIILLLGSVSAIIWPITSYGLAIGCIAILIWNYKIEKKIRNKQTEMKTNANLRNQNTASQSNN